MKESTLIAVGALLAVVLSAQLGSHPERNANTVVRDVLAKLTGQPIPERRLRARVRPVVFSGNRAEASGLPE
jgi:hypothetical protein